MYFCAFGTIDLVKMSDFDSMNTLDLELIHGRLIAAFS